MDAYAVDKSLQVTHEGNVYCATARYLFEGNKDPELGHFTKEFNLQSVTINDVYMKKTLQPVDPNEELDKVILTEAMK